MWHGEELEQAVIDQLRMTSDHSYLPTPIVLHTPTPDGRMRETQFAATHHIWREAELAFVYPKLMLQGEIVALVDTTTWPRRIRLVPTGTQRRSHEVRLRTPRAVAVVLQPGTDPRDWRAMAYHRQWTRALDIELMIRRLGVIAEHVKDDEEGALNAFHGLMQEAMEGDLADIDWCEEYKEPGYTNPPSGILFANWNHRLEDHIGELAEKLGYAIEWSDEWARCDGCYGAVRTSPDSYSWTQSFWYNDGEIFCHDCVRADPSAYLEHLIGDPHSADTLDIDLEAHGFVEVDIKFASGLYGGQADDPEKIAALLESCGITRFIFRITSMGQFDVHFKVFVEAAQLADATTALEEGNTHGFDPAAAMQRALLEAAKLPMTPRGNGKKD